MQKIRCILPARAEESVPIKPAGAARERFRMPPGFSGQRAGQKKRVLHNISHAARTLAMMRLAGPKNARIHRGSEGRCRPGEPRASVLAQCQFRCLRPFREDGQCRNSTIGHKQQIFAGLGGQCQIRLRYHGSLRKSRLVRSVRKHQIHP